MFKCHCCGETVANEKMVMVPNVIRRVTYRNHARKFRSKDLEFVNEKHGWEIVQEVPVAESHAEAYLANHEPKYEKSEKTVNNVIKNRAVREDFRNQ